jgi:hypothetical protein
LALIPIRVFVSADRQTDDWWFWENDERLHIDSKWILKCQLPHSVEEFCMELESLERRKDQIDYIAKHMVEDWWFARSDNMSMKARTEDFVVNKWRGSSTWNDHRWLRDEVAPSLNEYYVKTVVFKPDESLKEPFFNLSPKLSVPNTFPILATFSHSSLPTRILDRAGILSQDPAEIAVSKFQAYENDRAAVEATRAAERAARAVERQAEARERRERRRADRVARTHAVTQQWAAAAGIGVSGCNGMVDDLTDQ